MSDYRKLGDFPNLRAWHPVPIGGVIPMGTKYFWIGPNDGLPKFKMTSEKMVVPLWGPTYYTENEIKVDELTEWSVEIALSNTLESSEELLTEIIQKLKQSIDTPKRRLAIRYRNNEEFYALLAESKKLGLVGDSVTFNPDAIGEIWVETY